MGKFKYCDMFSAHHINLTYPKLIITNKINIKKISILGLKKEIKKDASPPTLRDVIKYLVKLRLLTRKVILKSRSRNIKI